jgi:hypothetical protein
LPAARCQARLLLLLPPPHVLRCFSERLRRRRSEAHGNGDVKRCKHLVEEPQIVAQVQQKARLQCSA